MKKSFAIAVLMTQMTVGVCLLMAGNSSRAECTCCHPAAADGAMLGACCRVGAPALPALEASAPFTVTAPTGQAPALVPMVAVPHIAATNPASLDECVADTSPPRLYLRNSTLLI